MTFFNLQFLGIVDAFVANKHSIPDHGKRLLKVCSINQSFKNCINVSDKFYFTETNWGHKDCVFCVNFLVQSWMYFVSGYSP